MHGQIKKQEEYQPIATAHLKQRPRDCSPSSNTRLKESLNTEWPKLSDKTTSPPVRSTAAFISATPT